MSEQNLNKERTHLRHSSVIEILRQEYLNFKIVSRKRKGRFINLYKVITNQFNSSFGTQDSTCDNKSETAIQRISIMYLRLPLHQRSSSLKRRKDSVVVAGNEDEDKFPFHANCPFFTVDQMKGPNTYSKTEKLTVDLNGMEGKLLGESSLKTDETASGQPLEFRREAELTKGCALQIKPRSQSIRAESCRKEVAVHSGRRNFAHVCLYCTIEAE